MPQTTSARKLTVVPEPTAEPSPAYRRDKLSHEPRDNNFLTDDVFFFGFRRRTPGARTPTAAMVADFVYSPQYDRAIRSLVSGANLMLIGPPGSGKTTLTTWLAHQIGLNYYPLAMYAHTQGEDILGKPAQNENGIWGFVPAPLVVAYTNGGLVCLDELLSLKAGVALLLNPFLNRDPIIVQTDTGETTITPHDDFRIIGTGNHWARTAGNFAIGEALADRMDFIDVEFLPTEIECDLLSNAAPNVSRGLIVDLVDFANGIRAGVKASPDTQRYCPSTRVLFKLVEKMEIIGYSFDEAVRDCIVEKLRSLFRDEYVAIVTALKAKLPLDTPDEIRDDL